jgi:hypothetical protein
VLTRILSRLTIAFQFVIAFVEFGITMTSITSSFVRGQTRFLTTPPCSASSVGPSYSEIFVSLWLGPEILQVNTQILNSPFCSDQSIP